MDILERMAERHRRILEPYEDAITTPHPHESKGNPPLWLIWKRIKGDEYRRYPMLDCVCNSEEMARPHIIMALEAETRDPPPHIIVDVERIPANHRFASSLEEWQYEAEHQRARYKQQWRNLDGD